MFKNMNKFIYFFILTLLNLFQISAEEGTYHPMRSIERRAAFDVGSGKIKLQVADVDTENNQIVEIIATAWMHVDFSQDLALSFDQNFSLSIQKQALAAFEKLKKLAESYSPDAYSGVATEAFRQARNASQLAEMIKDQLAIPVHIISQEEEGILGFMTATAAAEADPDNVVVWDTGGGSFQITAKSGEDYIVYRGRLGRVPVKNLFISSIKGKNIEEVRTPNPVTIDDVEKATLLIKDRLMDIPSLLLEKFAQENIRVLGIGAQPRAMVHSYEKYTSKMMRDMIEVHINLTDDQIEQISPWSLNPVNPADLAQFVVSDLTFALSVMEIFGISAIEHISPPAGNSTGLLLESRYWQAKARAQQPSLQP